MALQFVLYVIQSRVILMKMDCCSNDLYGLMSVF